MNESRDRLHKLVWQNDISKLKEIFENEDVSSEINAFDCRGNTILILALMLGRVEMVKLICEKGASCTTRNRLGWQPIHEARCLGDRTAISCILNYRRIQMERFVKTRSEKTIEKIQELPDFYLEMKWDFSSWIPFVSRFCPSDTYKIWKKGSCVRADTTLKGFEHLKWVRGDISFIYRASAGDIGNLYIVDHEQKIYENVKPEDREEKIEERVNFLMNTKIRYGTFDAKGITFTRSKTGPMDLFGSGKSETVGAFDADIYTVSGVKVKSMTRTEHLVSSKKSASEVEDVEEIIEEGTEGKEEEILEKVKKFEIGKKDTDLEKMYNDAKSNALRFKDSLPPPPPPSVSFEEYFNPELQPKRIKKSSSSSLSLASLSSSLGFGDKPEKSLSSANLSSTSLSEQQQDFEPLHVGREMNLSTSKKSLKATLWMSNSFPLFIEELLPIMEILAPANSHFGTLKEFVELKLPRGFPVKIEIPLFGVLTATITFQNFVSNPEMDENLFVVPEAYLEGEVKMAGS